MTPPPPPPHPRRPQHLVRSASSPTYLARDVRVVHEDDQLLVVDKPVGLVTADPARASGPGMNKARPSAREGETLFDYVKNYVRAKSPSKKSRRRTEADGGEAERSGRVWVIHRLDKEASGLLVFAKTIEAFEKLKEQFRDKDAHRIYLAVAEGEVGPPGSTGTRESMIEEDRGPTPGKKMLTGRGRSGAKRPAVTHYRVLGTDQQRSLLEVKLETGRKNQIRIHMQELGHPLVGDRRFGAASDAIGRLGLHAAELGFVHPGTGKAERFVSPAPVSFYRAVGMKPPRDDAQSDEQSPSTPAKPAADTSWDEVAGWYDRMLDDKGSDHYEQVILPGAIELLRPKAGMRILDVACGQGILCRKLSEMNIKVTGIDAAPRLIDAAKQRSPQINYRVGDARNLASLGLTGFDGATCIMALSNIDPLEPALRGIAAALRPGGALVCIITHPAFRAPGQTHWGWDDKAKRQFRRVDAYLTPFRKEIQMHPGKAAAGKQEGAITTPTFHRPLSAYIRALGSAGLLVEDMREWPSERAASSGPRAPEENRTRLEIPLFLGIRAIKTAQ